MKNCNLYVVVEQVAYEGGAICGIFFDKLKAEDLQKRLQEDQEINGVSYDVFCVEEGEEVRLSI